MKIFHCVESYFPSIGGMQEVVKQLSERLVKLGHEVFVLTRAHPERDFKVLNGVKIIEFNIIDNPFIATTEAELQYVHYLLNTVEGIVTFFAAQQWATNLALPILKKIKAKKVSVPTGYSGLYWPAFKTYFEDMKSWIHDYDMNVYLSNDYRDINYAKENHVKNITLIPNGAAEDEFLAPSKIDIRKVLNIDPTDFLILHVGSYTAWKGHQEAIELFLKSDIKKGVLLMIGNNYENFSFFNWKNPKLLWLLFFHKISGRKKIIFNYFPRDFTVNAYRQADLFLFPSNIECSPIVLFECAAAKLPFLSTDVGNAKEIAEWTKGGEILPTTKNQEGFSFARISEGVNSLNMIYQDEKKRKAMGQTAFENWQQKYSWEVITKQYEALYTQLLKE